MNDLYFSALAKRRRCHLQLLFDSSARKPNAFEVKPLGTRALGGDGSRHLLYQADHLCLDLLFEDSIESDEVILLGQVADPYQPDKPLAHIPVAVVSVEAEAAAIGETVLVDSKTNRLGEFQLRYPQRENLFFWAEVDGERLLEVALAPGSLSGAAEQGE